MTFQLEVGIHNNDTKGIMCSNNRQASGPCAGGNVRGKCPKLQMLWTQTHCGFETAVLLRTRIIGQDSCMDVD